MNEELRKLMECYRPGHEGAGDAEFAVLRQADAEDSDVHEQFEAVQAWDARIARAMRAVPVPDSLEDRLLAAIDVAEKEPADADHAAMAARQRPPRWWNRWPARVAAAALSAAALILVMYHALGWNDTLASGQVVQAARGWIATLNEQHWRQSTPPGDEYQHPALNFPLDAWQYVEAMGDAQAVAYRATVPPDRARAVLFVVHTRKGRLLPERPPTVPDSTTGNVCIGVWKRDDHLYVLAVQGTQQTYRRLLKTQAIAQRFFVGAERDPA